MTVSSFRIVGRIAVTLLVLLGVGCQSTSNHEKNVSAANKRWKTMRATLILQMAQQQFDAGDLEQAERTLSEALQIDRSNGQLYTLAGRVAMERSQLERAYHRFKLAIEMDSTLALPHYYQAIVLQRWTHFEAALDFYSRAYELEPDNAGYLLAMTEMLVILDRSDEAMKVLTDKMAYFDLNAGIRVAIGRLYMMRNQPAQALEYFHQAYLIRPDDLNIREDLATAQLRTGKPHEAVRNFELIRNHPNYANRRDIKRVLADSYMAAGRASKAKSVYMELTHSNPMDVEAWVSLGEVSLNQRDASSALLAATRIKKIAPDRHEGYMLSGIVWQQQKKWIKRSRCLIEPHSLPPMTQRRCFCWVLHLNKTIRSLSRKAYAEALRRRPNDSRAQKLLGKIKNNHEKVNVLTSN